MMWAQARYSSIILSMKESINKELLEFRKKIFYFSPVLVIALNKEIYAKPLVWGFVHTKGSINSSYCFYRSECAEELHKG